MSKTSLFVFGALGFLLAATSSLPAAAQSRGVGGDMFRLMVRLQRESSILPGLKRLTLMRTADLWTRPDIPKLPTFTATTHGSETIPGTTIPTIASSIPGSTGILRAALGAGMCFGLLAEAGIVSGLEVSILA